MPLITTTARSLIQKGLLKSEQHSRDKRSKVLTLTPEGENEVSEIENYLESNLSKLEEGASQSELSTYFHMLQTLSQNASTIARAS
jgi:MarR family transcriptional regulator for hemolysin